MRMRISRWTTATAGLVAMMLAVAAVPSPALALDASLSENLATVMTASSADFTPSPATVPVVESVLGQGEPLSTNAANRINIPGATGESALVRITVWGQAANIDVYTGVGATPVLHASAGQTSSTTTLLPIRNGSISLFASIAAEVRIEVLAQLRGSTRAPGSTMALDSPVTRADTQNGLAGSAVDTAGLWVGLVGEGGVPAELVRSVYVAVAAEVPAPTELIIDGQRVGLAAGRNVFTTVVTPDTAGGTSLQLAGTQSSAAGSVRVDVQGWVAEGEYDLTAANVQGSFIPAPQPETLTFGSLAGGDPKSFDVADHDDLDYVLALVSSDQASQTTVLDWRTPATGRASGIALQADVGAPPQLALVPMTDAGGVVELRRGSASVTIHELGGFVGAAQAAPAGAATATVKIVSPGNKTRVDVTESAFFTLEGTATQGDATLDRIEISSPEVGFIGFAEVNYTGEQITWSFPASAPNDGLVEYEVAVFERGAQSAVHTDRIEITIDVPDASDTVTNPDLVVLDTVADMPAYVVRGVSQVVFAAQPKISAGQIVISGITVGAPEGFLGRVKAINNVGGEWVVDHSPVSLEEYIYQADIEVDADYGDGSEITLVDTSDDAPLAGSTYVDAQNQTQQLDPEFSLVAPGSQLAAEIVTGDEIDLDPFSGPDAQVRVPGDGQEPVGAEISDDGEWLPTLSAAPQLPLTKGFDSTFSFSLGAKLLVKLSGNAPEVENHTRQTQDQFIKNAKNEMEHKAAIALTVNAQTDVRVVLVLNASVNLKWKFWKTKVSVNEFTVKIGTKLKGETSVVAFAEANRKFGLHQKLVKGQLPSVTVPVGAVPVIITNEIDLNLGAQLEGSITAEMPVLGASREDWFGFTYATGKSFQRIKEDPVITAPEVSFAPTAGKGSVHVDATLAVGPELAFSTRIYSLAGPTFSFYALAGVEGTVTAADLNHPTHLTATFAVFVKLGLNGAAKLTLLGFEVLNVNVFRLEWKTVIFSREFEFDLI